jgi:nucleoid DNA-binding protein
MKITQLAFVEQLAAKSGITSSEAKRIVETLKTFIYTALANGNTVELSGFGQFSVSHREPRQGVNPRQPTERISIPALNTPKFKAGQAFKDAVVLKQ